MKFSAVTVALLASTAIAAPLVVRQETSNSAGSTSTSTSNCSGLFCGLSSSGAAAAENGPSSNTSTSSTTTTSCSALTCAGSSGAAGPTSTSASSSTSSAFQSFKGFLRRFI